MRRTSRKDEDLAVMMSRGGHGREEIAATIGVSKRTVNRILRRAEEREAPNMDGATMTDMGILAMMAAKFAQAEQDLICYRRLAEKEPDNPRWTNL
ncbi:MAG: helix-turn-helix domain-containing protein [Candidatus Methanomethylophilaceae archaeon]|nr:helix-turn-helix domain-containing protein [Candidatus Methanomethylophilaceae archaeon]